MAVKPTNVLSDAGKSPKQLYDERLKRLGDAAELKQPDRVPVSLSFSYMLAEYGGITKQELHENPAKAQAVLEKAALEFQPDSIMGVFSGPETSIVLGDRMTKWPGHGLDPNVQFQFVESEFMKAQDYDEFLEDPADWCIRVYLPRAFSALEGLSMLPPLGMFLLGYYGSLALGSFTAPPLMASFRAIGEAIQKAAVANENAAKSMQRLAELGFPPSPIFGSLIEAPFDFMSDTLRGMRGIMLDMLQRPDKLLAAQEKVLRFQVKHAVAFKQATGMTACFIPLHRGSDGFMSLPQFEKFYWPQLKAMMLELVDNGITPACFYEGVWDERLEYLAELPKGKTVGWFQASDIFKVKEVVGDTMCICGGMPNALLASGTVESVRAHTKKVCEVVGKGGGFIMGTGVGEMSGSKPELVKAWVDAVKEFGVY